MQLARILAVGALAGAFAGAQPVLSQDVTLEFVVWNYSLETIQDNIAKFEAANPGHQGQRHRLHLARLPGQPRPPLPRQYTDRRHLWRSGLVAGLGRRRLHRAARARRARRRLDALQADIAGFALTDVTYNGKVYGLPYYADTISFIYNKKILADAGIAVPDHLGGGDRRRREAQGGRHGASDRLRVQSGAAELLRRLRRAGLWPRRRALRHGSQPALRRSRTTTPTSSSQWLADAYRRTWSSRRRMNRRSSRR